MAYKLMAVDIDGTLLDNNGRMTAGTIKAVRKAVEKGLIFTLSTGRPVQGVQSLVNKLGLDLPIITYNGAMVVMGKSMDILYEQGLAADDVRTIAGLGEKYGTTITIWSGNKLYANKLNERAVKYSQLSGTTPILLSNLEEVIKEGVSKILWYDEVEQIDRYEREIETLLSGNVNFHTSQPYFLEFVDRKASKAIAMEKLGEHFGICREEMIAVGDGFNDLSMIEYAGLGVAMENARDAIKQKADYVTLSNDEDGVAHVIYKFVLGED